MSSPEGDKENGLLQENTKDRYRDDKERRRRRSSSREYYRRSQSPSRRRHSEDHYRRSSYDRSERRRRDHSGYDNHRYDDRRRRDRYDDGDDDKDDARSRESRDRDRHRERRPEGPPRRKAFPEYRVVATAKDEQLGDVHDDPRGEDPTKRITKKASSRGNGRNTESFDPASTLVRPDLRIHVGSSKSNAFDRPLKHDDVVIVPELFGPHDDWSMYYQLVNELRDIQAKGVSKGSEWISWHEGAHLICKNPTESPTFNTIIDRLCEYFHIRKESIGTRFNWYRDRYVIEFVKIIIASAISISNLPFLSFHSRFFSTVPTGNPFIMTRLHLIHNELATKTLLSESALAPHESSRSFELNHCKMRRKCAFTSLRPTMECFPLVGMPTSFGSMA